MARSRKQVGSLRPAPVRASQPQVELGVARLGGHGFFQRFGGLFEIALHVVVTADQVVDHAVFLRDCPEDLQGLLELRKIVQLASLVELRPGGPQPTTQTEQQYKRSQSITVPAWLAILP